MCHKIFPEKKEANYDSLVEYLEILYLASEMNGVKTEPLTFWD